MRQDNLTVSRIHILLRPFETKLVVLARLLEKRVASDVYAPSTRPQGVTYAKRHRIRFLTGLSSRQATRAYALEQQQGIAKRYNVHQQVIGVEDAFRHLVRSVVIPEDQRVPTLRGLIAKMVGRQAAHETLRDKDELEEEGIDDCIGHWYGDLTVDTRRDALVAHALQLVELRLPVFIPELWSGLLTIALEAKLHVEASILLEYILLSFFTPHSDSAECPATYMGRQLTDLYVEYTTHLCSADFFAVLLPILERSPPHIWTLRAVNHLVRHIDAAIAPTCIFLHALARNTLFHLTSPLSSLDQTAKEMLLEGLYSRTLALLEMLVSNEMIDQEGEISSKETINMLDYLGYLVHTLWTHSVRVSSPFYADYFRLIVAFDAWLFAHSQSIARNLRVIERLRQLDAALAKNERDRADLFALCGLYTPAALDRVYNSCENATLHAVKMSLEVGVQRAERYLARAKRKRKREQTDVEPDEVDGHIVSKRARVVQTETELTEDGPPTGDVSTNESQERESVGSEEEWNASLDAVEESAGESYRDKGSSSSSETSEDDEDDDRRTERAVRPSGSASSQTSSSSDAESSASRESSPKRSRGAKGATRGKSSTRGRGRPPKARGSRLPPKARGPGRPPKTTNPGSTARRGPGRPPSRKTRKQSSSESSTFSLDQASSELAEDETSPGSEEEATLTHYSHSEGEERSMDAALSTTAEREVEDVTYSTGLRFGNDASSVDNVNSDVETSLQTDNLSSEVGDEADSSILRISSFSRYKTPVLHSVLTAKLGAPQTISSGDELGE
ncbi:hypothetical protein PIIN_03539 [Serendipita indica DSM 11827]|uniref:Uncharacterized protein n=1 Tax=Serendipita indica (strain DSM 11827) TaxID=1109443 RepID=G4TE57_SERID|nr:hypothetical protein PIIN_03539 [Serendipita indica DSM 11827]